MNISLGKTTEIKTTTKSEIYVKIYMHTNAQLFIIYDMILFFFIFF